MIRLFFHDPHRVPMLHRLLSNKQKQGWNLHPVFSDSREFYNPNSRKLSNTLPSISSRFASSCCVRFLRSLLKSRSPYLSSPRTGCPIAAICTRIWCVRPVKSSISTRLASPSVVSTQKLSSQRSAPASPSRQRRTNESSALFCTQWTRRPSLFGTPRTTA